jgi:hypothetical protein
VVEATPKPNWGGWPPLNFYILFFIKKKKKKLGIGHFEKKKKRVRIVELQQFGSLGWSSVTF